MSDRSPHILLIEDNPGEARLIDETFRQSARTPHLHVFPSAVAALDYLRNDADAALVAKPSLILLDLKLPEMSGIEFLTILKADDSLKRIPVVVLTASDAAKDINESYRQSANGYVTKPSGLEDLREVIRGIDEFWLMTVTLPSF